MSFFFSYQSTFRAPQAYDVIDNTAGSTSSQSHQSSTQKTNGVLKPHTTTLKTEAQLMNREKQKSGIYFASSLEI